MTAATDGFEWVRAIEEGALDEGRVMTAVAAGRVLAIRNRRTRLAATLAR